MDAAAADSAARSAYALRHGVAMLLLLPATYGAMPLSFTITRQPTYMLLHAAAAAAAMLMRFRHASAADTAAHNVTCSCYLLLFSLLR